MDCANTVADIGSFEGTPQQLAQLVLDQITTHPETHNQHDWVNACQTTACIAGWALLFRDGDVSPFSRLIEPWAAEALGLGTYDAGRLFYFCTNEQARHALKYLANGEKIDWVAVGHKFRSDEMLAVQMGYHLRAARRGS